MTSTVKGFAARMEERQKLRKELFAGDISRIAAAAGVHPSTVSRFFAGECHNGRVYEQTLALLIERENLRTRTHGYRSK